MEVNSEAQVIHCVKELVEGPAQSTEGFSFNHERAVRHRNWTPPRAPPSEHVCATLCVVAARLMIKDVWTRPDWSLDETACESAPFDRRENFDSEPANQNNLLRPALSGPRSKLGSNLRPSHQAKGSARPPLWRLAAHTERQISSRCGQFRWDGVDVCSSRIRHGETRQMLTVEAQSTDKHGH